MGYNHGTCGDSAWVSPNGRELVQLLCSCGDPTRQTCFTSRPYNVLGELSCYLVRWSQLLIFPAICF